MEDKELTKIVLGAIDLPECPIKKQAAIMKRIWLRQQIIKYVAAQLEKQFNAKQLNECTG